MATVLALIGALLPASAQRVSMELRAADKPYIQATGEATVSAKPDRALIEVGVVTQGATAAAASAQNAKQTDAVLAGLRKVVSSGDQLRTTAYSVRPNYQYPKPGAAPVINGYTAINTVEATLDDLSLVSKVIDSSTQSGANNIQKLEYRLKDPRVVRAKALRRAAEGAKANVEAIAAGLGLKILRVLAAEEPTSDEGIGVYRKAAAVATAAPAQAVATPVEVGMIEVSATVTLRTGCWLLQAEKPALLSSAIIEASS
jgi:uncharacterized protein YggE